jgi:hypothetical protein
MLLDTGYNESEVFFWNCGAQCSTILVSSDASILLRIFAPIFINEIDL